MDIPEGPASMSSWTVGIGGADSRAAVALSEVCVPPSSLLLGVKAGSGTDDACVPLLLA